MDTRIISSKRLYINSKDRTKGTASNFELIQPNYINLHDTELKIRVSVLKCTIPNSFYSVVGGVNNILTIRESDDDGITNVNEFTLNFVEGNYNVIKFKTEFTRLLGLSPSTFTYEVDFNVINHKLTFSITDVSKQVIFKFSESTSLYKRLGFNNIDYTFNTTITSPNVINLAGIHNVFVKTNLINDGSIDQKTGKNSRTLISIPLTEPHYNLITYRKLTHFDDIIITNRTINDLNIELTDEDGNHLNLNGEEWTLALIFDIIKI